MKQLNTDALSATRSIAHGAERGAPDSLRRAGPLGTQVPGAPGDTFGDT